MAGFGPRWRRTHLLASDRIHGIIDHLHDREAIKRDFGIGKGLLQPLPWNSRREGHGKGGEGDPPITQVSLCQTAA